jgi:peptidyl-prolyl cis-trans isomerase C
VKKTTTTFIGVALVASLALAQDKPAGTAATAAPATAAAAQTNGDPVIITAGDIMIHQSEFESALKTLPDQYQAYASGVGKRQFADDYLKMKMLAAQGYKNGVQNQDDVVRQLALMRDNLVANAELSRIEKTVAPSDADLKKAYDANRTDYEQVKARHILVAFKGSPAVQKGKPELTEEQAKAKAEEIRKKLVAGADFGEVAKKESDDLGSGSRGGELGSFGHGQMVPEFEKAAFDLKAGEISPLVRTQYGFHIIKVDQHTLTPFEEVKPTLEKGARQKKLQETMDTMKTAANPVYDTVYFAPPAPPAAPAMAAPASGGRDSSKPAENKSPADAKKSTKKPGTGE